MLKSKEYNSYTIGHAPFAGVIAVAFPFAFHLFLEGAGLSGITLELVSIFIAIILVIGLYHFPMYSDLFKQIKVFRYGAVVLYSVTVILPYSLNTFFTGSYLWQFASLIGGVGIWFNLLFYMYFISHKNLQAVGWHTNVPGFTEPQKHSKTALFLLALIILTFGGLWLLKI